MARQKRRTYELTATVRRHVWSRWKQIDFLFEADSDEQAQTRAKEELTEWVKIFYRVKEPYLTRFLQSA